MNFLFVKIFLIYINIYYLLYIKRRGIVKKFFIFISILFLFSSCNYNSQDSAIDSSSSKAEIPLNYSESEDSFEISSSESSKESSDDSSLPAEQGNWQSPTGWHPYTSQAVLDYYEAHPQWKEYYWDYLVPLSSLLGDEWSPETPPSAAAVTISSLLSSSRKERDRNVVKQDLYGTGIAYPVVNQDWVEAYAQRMLNLSPEVLRQEDECYFPKQAGYLYLPSGPGVPMSAVIRNVTELESQLLITYDWLLIENFPQRSPDYQDYPDGQQYQLEIRFREYGTGYCAACRLVN